MDAELEGEEIVQDLSVGVVCKKNYEEPESCGSAADFLLGVEMEGQHPVEEKVEGDDPILMIDDEVLSVEMEGQHPVEEKVDGDDPLLKTNDSNKCRLGDCPSREHS